MAERVVGRGAVAKSQRAIQLGTNPDHAWLLVDFAVPAGDADEARELARRLDRGETRLEVIVVEVPGG